MSIISSTVGHSWRARPRAWAAAAASGDRLPAAARIFGSIASSNQREFFTGGNRQARACISSPISVSPVFASHNAEAGSAYLFDATFAALGLDTNNKRIAERIAEAETPADLNAILDEVNAEGKAEIERRKLVNQTTSTLADLLKEVFINTLFKLLP